MVDEVGEPLLSCVIVLVAKVGEPSSSFIVFSLSSLLMVDCLSVSIIRASSIVIGMYKSSQQVILFCLILLMWLPSDLGMLIL